MRKAEELCYQFEQQTLHAMAWGESTKPIVLCLHGWLDNAASFIPLAQHLTAYRVIALDWPGHGLSSHRSNDAHYHFIDYVYDLLNLFNLNGWQNIDIVAHSMGGMIATAFAAAFPEYVRTLTVIDSLGFLTVQEDKTTLQLREGMLSRVSSINKRKAIHPTVESAVNARMVVSDLTQAHAQLIVERGLIKLAQGYTWSADQRLRTTSVYRFTLAQAKQLVSDITAPVLLLYGDKGLDMVAQGIAQYQSMFKRLQLMKLSGGHHIHMEQAQKTADEISAFIQSNPCNN